MRGKPEIDAVVQHLAQNRGLRVALIGGLLLLVGLMLGAGSVWTVPALVGGSVLLLAGVLGTRLSGRLALEWGESGASLEMRAQIAPPPPGDGAQLELSERLPTVAEKGVIESSGETIETDLIELRRVLPAEKPSAAARTGA